MMSRVEPVLLLVGAGHAHLGVIDDWRKHGPPAARTVLVEPLDAMHYSGMVPGWIAGEYRASELQIPLALLVRQAGIEWHKASLVAMDPVARIARLDDGSDVGFDICSLATGGAGQAGTVLGSDPRLLDIRPLPGFVSRWQALREIGPKHRRIAVVGGGAGGVELAFGFRNSEHWSDCAVVLVAGEHGLLPDHGAPVRHRARHELAAQGIEVLSAEAQFADGELVADGRSLEPLDLVVAAVGSGAPDWPRESGLPTDADGFIEVDGHQRVCGFPQILAAGDVARRTDRHVGHAGVHAVYSGPVLAKNLRRMLAGKAPRRSYSPRFMDFYLLNTCRGESILSYAGLGLQGRWLRRLKDWLDTRWIRRFTVRGAS
ncbi:FAD-dependent oxidoreductase [Qipengyuania sp. 6B39]|uniref:NAD(P)/FAD-dependent oxidoreductase n=1 Tax=Qipengyuania proteolytica TaxID=2867239 RepID=UPI001C89B159|nr:FAD-dependent oxidoreductase [Qipengyuania proteolytica]MBX7496621.1 FAD-dependent oxidoreductase [Qipengyuania proteolytica]